MSCQKLQKGKAIPVTGRGGPQVCKTLTLQHFLETRLTDGDEDGRLTPRPPFEPMEIPFFFY
jgi:hypothetical protein